MAPHLHDSSFTPSAQPEDLALIQRTYRCRSPLQTAAPTHEKDCTNPNESTAPPRGRHGSHMGRMPPHLTQFKSPLKLWTPIRCFPLTFV
eukprot:303594-Rhodomonas_salina.2